MITDVIVKEAESFLFGKTFQVSKEFHTALTQYMKKQFNELQCVVLYKVSTEFQAFLQDFPELPNIERREFIVNSSGKILLSLDYLYPPIEHSKW